jgi:hypothetical protein
MQNANRCGVVDCTRTDFHIHADDVSRGMRVRACNTSGCVRTDKHLDSACENVEGRRIVHRPSIEAIDHPSHYGGKDNPYETIKVIAAWRLGFTLGNCVKYISRAGKKDPAKLVEDLKKAAWYLNEAITRLERGEELF